MTPARAPLLLALDLDGTLIDRTLRVAPRVQEAIARARERGVRATIVTGRMFVAAQPFARLLGIDGPIVCYQGAAVYDAGNGRRLRETPLAHDVAIRVVERAKRDGYHAQLYHDDEFYAEANNKYSALYAELAGIKPIIVPSLAAEFAGRDSTKCNIIMEPERTAAYVEVVRAVCGEEGYVTRSNPEFIEVMNPRVDKGAALRFVAAQYGVPMERVLAIGDSFNDIPLFRAAGFSVAMGSSPGELKAVASAIVADYAGDGVAEAVERFVLHGSAQSGGAAP